MGLLSSVGDAIGGAVDFVGDALGGGGIGAAIGGALGSVVPGVGTALGAKIGGGAASLFGGGGGGGGGGDTPLFGEGGVISTSPVDFGPVQADPGAALDYGQQLIGMNGGQTKGPKNAMMMMGGGDFQSALMASLVAKSVRSSAGRSIMEALAAGSLSGGIIQDTVTVNTPRGVENHSPPGFRTVYLNGEPFAVFKPLAKSLGLLPKTSKAKITAADMKAITKADRLAKTLKRLGQKTGRLKITNK